MEEVDIYHEESLRSGHLDSKHRKDDEGYITRRDCGEERREERGREEEEKRMKKQKRIRGKKKQKESKT